MAVEFDLEAQGVAGARQVAVVGQFAAEQAVDPLALVVAVHAQVGDQHQVGLAALDQHAGRQVAVVQEFTVPAHVGLGPDHALAHAAGLGLQAGDAVGQQQRRLRHAHLAQVSVLMREGGAEQVGDAAVGVLFQLLAAEARTDGNALRRRHRLGDGRRGR